MNETAQQYIQRIIAHVEGKQPLAVQAATAKKLERLIKGVPTSKLRKRPAADKWSVSEVVAHLGDAEIVIGFRMRMILGAPGTRSQLPNYKLNLFLQTKRPEYYKRRPRSVAKLAGTRAPLWAFHITSHQQKLLEVLADTTQGRAHVTYACAAFHTNAALFAHMKNRTIVENSTFPSVARLSGHSAWYYWLPGASGTANADPENIEEPSLFDRIRTLSRENRGYEPGDITWLDVTAREVMASVLKLQGQTDAVSAHFLDDLQTLSRLAESYAIPPSFLAYAQISLFSIRFDLNWLVVADMPL